MDDSITYIGLLRGINVGGHRPLKMKELREMFTQMGFEHVSTYIQSGNVVFGAPEKDKDLLANEIRDQIKETFGYDVSVIIFVAKEVKSILNLFPFEEKEGWRGYITFLANQPNSEQQQKLEAQSSNIETFCVGNCAVYAHVDKQTNEKPLFSSNFVQKQLNIPATNRNLRSVRKILSLAFSSK